MSRVVPLTLLLACFPRLGEDATGADAPGGDTGTDVGDDDHTGDDTDRPDDTDEPDDTDDGWPDVNGDTTMLALWYYSTDTMGVGYDTNGVVWPVAPARVEMWQLWGDQVDDCSGGTDAVELAAWDGGVDLVADDGTVYDLAWDGQGFRGSWDASAWSRVDAMGVRAGSGQDGPAFQTDAFFDAPPAFSITSPYFLADTAYHYGGDLDVAWSGGAEDFVLLMLAGDTGATLYCVLDDDGAFRVSASDLRALDSVWIQITLGRFRTAEAVRAHDLGVVQGSGAYFTTGWIYAL